MFFFFLIELAMDATAAAGSAHKLTSPEGREICRADDEGKKNKHGTTCPHARARRCLTWPPLGHQVRLRHHQIGGVGDQQLAFLVEAHPYLCLNVFGIFVISFTWTSKAKVGLAEKRTRERPPRTEPVRTEERSLPTPPTTGKT